MNDLRQAYDALRTPDWVVILAASLRGLFDPPMKIVIVNGCCMNHCHSKANDKMEVEA